MKGTGWFLKGVKSGIPIGLGYLAVSFSLGFTAVKAGLTPLQGMLASLLCNASAGEYAGFSVIAEDAAYIEIALATLIANARYLLMSCSLSQRLRPDLPWPHRLLLAFGITDELYAISVMQPGYITPAYTYGAFMVAVPCWAGGTALGALAGQLMPARLVSALSVALYGMFIAVIVPPARKSRVLCGIIAACFVLSYAFARLPVISAVSSGTRTIILTVVIAAAAAIIFPRKEEDDAA